ncbi:hypothetical protein LUZ61_003582 [Rhynchospora tenuis]|uniref:Protein kinase domain-containing protein n=1 Tax=Rhynchospora tenuis TaxID=198213 RepID=A0AAD5ZL22_9POAL|nr:hypothetical protein LUZ61_003582 [Rhynchospora tenuis]
MPMALSTTFLLSSFFLSLLLLIIPSHCILGSASATLAINQATGTVCGITTGSQNHSIVCTMVQESASLVPSFPIDPTLSFNSISGGQNCICSLITGSAFEVSQLYCWEGINQQVSGIDFAPMVLTELSVGAQHVATIEGDPMKTQTIRWWKDVCHSCTQPCPDFPESIDGVFHSLTSGDLFTCAIGETHNVNCWGPNAKSILMRFSGVNMRSVTAGGSRMCGLNMTGHLICSGEQFGMLPGEAFEYTSLAIGSNHTCAIRRKNGTVVCWGQYGSYFPVGSSRFVFLVAGGDRTCGLTIDALNVMCWGLNERNLSAVTLSLPQILPGLCIPDETFCTCGVYQDSSHLCGGSGIICKRSDSCTMESFELPQPSSMTTSERLSKWSVFAIYGGVFLVAVIGFLSYLMCLRFGCRGEEEINSESEEEAGLLDSDDSDLGSTENQGGPIPPDLENLETFSFKDLKDATKNFSWCTRVGVGSFGVVYKGQLSDGRLVAVKRCRGQARQGVSNRDFVYNAELKTQAKAHHGNVVSLIGYCIENNERIIVFEYMAEKDLYGHLHPKLWERKSQIFKSWRLRVKVLLDAARGINYLHQEANPRIIHRDIKSSNILIDDSWVAKISDFGFALVGPAPGRTYMEVRRVFGTVGYMDPLWNSLISQLATVVTPQSDTYSFGVVMLEVITGRKAYDEHKQLFLANLDVTAENLGKVLDRRLAFPVGREMTAVQMVMQIAKRCVNRNERPLMTAVVGELERALALFDQPEASNN